MMEIMNLGTDSQRETSQSKLYQLCLEKGEAIPKYCIDKVQTYQGVTYVATCTALGYTNEGSTKRFSFPSYSNTSRAGFLTAFLFR